MNFNLIKRTKATNKENSKTTVILSYTLETDLEGVVYLGETIDFLEGRIGDYTLKSMTILEEFDASQQPTLVMKYTFEFSSTVFNEVVGAINKVLGASDDQ